MGSLAATIPGLAQHRAKPSQQPYSWQDAKRHIDQALHWAQDSIPDDLLEWLSVHDAEQFGRVMAAWHEIEVCDQNQDLAGVRSACSGMVLAMQQGLRLYNASPAPREQQAALF